MVRFLYERVTAQPELLEIEWIMGLSFEWGSTGDTMCDVGWRAMLSPWRANNGSAVLGHKIEPQAYVELRLREDLQRAVGSVKGLQGGRCPPSRACAHARIQELY